MLEAPCVNVCARHRWSAVEGVGGVCGVVVPVRPLVARGAARDGARCASGQPSTVCGVLTQEIKGNKLNSLLRSVKRLQYVRTSDFPDPAEPQCRRSAVSNGCPIGRSVQF